MASRNPLFGILWLILLFFLAWPVAGIACFVSFLHYYALMRCVLYPISYSQAFFVIVTYSFLVLDLSSGKSYLFQHAFALQCSYLLLITDNNAFSPFSQYHSSHLKHFSVLSRISTLHWRNSSPGLASVEEQLLIAAAVVPSLK